MNRQDAGVRNWRSIILLGRNVASFKFALGKTLLALAEDEKTFVSMEDLALPYALHVAEHIKRSDRQTTSRGSRFMDICRSYNRRAAGADELREAALRLAFQNVIDAFHVVNRADVPTHFYIDERRQRGGLVLTDQLLALAQTKDFPNLETEIEARWRLVETAWSLEVPAKLLRAGYDSSTEEIFVSDRRTRRASVTKFRNALNGYQRGKCFYCDAAVSIAAGHDDLADVDHYFPHTLAYASPSLFHSRADGDLVSSTKFDSDVNIDGIWNLVLSCKECNRGIGGKSARIPDVEYLERLYKRNEYLIKSHLPLRETLLAQTGQTEKARRNFISRMDRNAIDTLIHRWRPSRS